METNPSHICPKCQSPIPADAPSGLCPKCVLAGAGTVVGSSPTAPDEAPAIQEIADLFPQLKIIELIGRGGMGVVFKARQVRLDRDVALKLLPKNLAADPHFAERFNREARVLAKLNHPNIVAVHDFGMAGGFCYLIMEYVDGLNLRQAMAAGRFSPAEALAIVPKVCDALQYAHDLGILHRDIKPENLLLDVKGRIKIADFGIAKLVGEEREPVTLTGTGTALGTPHYMAPEQLENPSGVDHRADIYSLGVVFYEMLTGELPIGRFAAPSARTPLDERLDEIVMRALARERELRQKDARELQTQVEGVSQTREITAPPLLGNRLRLAWVATSVATIVVLGLALLFFRPPSIELGPEHDAQLTRRKVEQPVREARQRFEIAEQRRGSGEISDRDLALARRDLAVAEARGNPIGIAAAAYQFADWNFREAREKKSLEEIWQAELEVYQADHLLALARAGTNATARAGADLRYAEMLFASAVRRKTEGTISESEFKKAQDGLLGASVAFKKLRASQTNDSEPEI